MRYGRKKKERSEKRGENEEWTYQGEVIKENDAFRLRRKSENE
jgi:hypothetical protein